MTKSNWTRSMPWVICILGALFYCYEYILRISPSVMTSQLMADFHISAGVFGALTAFYYYAYTAMQLPVGLIVDKYGPRMPLTFACLSCAIGTIIFSMAHVIWIAELGRFLIGFGSAFAFVGVMKLAAIWLPANRFAFFIGFATMMGGAGGIIGDQTLTLLVHNVGWRESLIYTALGGIVLALLMFLIIRNGKRYKTPDSELLSINHLFHQLIMLLKRPQILLVGVIGLLFYLPIPAFAELWGIPFLEQARHFTAPEAADGISYLFFGCAMGAPLIGWFSDHIAKRKMPMLIGAILAAVIASIILFFKFNLYTTYFLLLIFGMCIGFEALIFPLGKENAVRGSSGSAVAIVNMIVMIGGIIFQPIIGVLLDFGWHGHLHHGVRHFTASDYQHALMVIPICLGLAALLCIFVRETGCKHVEY